MKIDKLRKNDTAEMMHRQSDQNRGTLQACFFYILLKTTADKGRSLPRCNMSRGPIAPHRRTILHVRKTPTRWAHKTDMDDN